MCYPTASEQSISYISNPTNDYDSLRNEFGNDENVQLLVNQEEHHNDVIIREKNDFQA